MSGAPPTVVSLAAWCDLDRMPKGAVSVCVTSFKVREYALLSDGREVTLLDDRGWGTNEPLAGMSVAHIVGNLHMAVLPDDAEETGEEHEWGHFVDRLREAGVAVTVDELRLVPYDIILSDRLRAVLGLPPAR